MRKKNFVTILSIFLIIAFSSVVYADCTGTPSVGVWALRGTFCVGSPPSSCPSPNPGGQPCSPIGNLCSIIQCYYYSGYGCCGGVQPWETEIYDCIQTADCSTYTTQPDCENAGCTWGVSYIDIGLRAFDGTEPVAIACEALGTLTSALRIAKDGDVYGIALVDPADPNASKVRIQTNSGIKALRKL